MLSTKKLYPITQKYVTYLRAKDTVVITQMYSLLH